MKISKEKVLKMGNDSMAVGALFSLSSVACPCPVCIGTSLLFIINGIREKLA
jgi:hypothetical protein